MQDVEAKGHAQFHDHDHFWFLIVGREALNQFWVVEVVHQLDLFTGSVSLLGTSTFVKLSSAHLPCFLVD